MEPKSYDSISKSHLAAARAVDQLRRQLGVILEEDNQPRAGAVPIEGLSEGLLAALKSDPKNKLSLLITSARAKRLGIDAGITKAVRIDATALGFEDLLSIADPLSDAKLPGPLATLPVTPACTMLLMMAKYASLLPALLAVESDRYPDDWLRVGMGCVSRYWNDPPLDIVTLASAKLPIEETENARLTCFRTRFGTSQHLALTIGDIGSVTNPLVRIHSSCITGDILGSLRCDCGDQLKLAIQHIVAEGAGILLYLHQEGRGIGITNKIRAYELQERGIDTYEANLMLGFDEDERDFSIAAGILKKLGVKNIRLLTNNPLKLAAIGNHGIKVASRVPLIAPTGPHNEAYLEAKAKKSGHLF